jgi:hypothetical protein
MIARAKKLASSTHGVDPTLKNKNVAGWTGCEIKTRETVRSIEARVLFSLRCEH